MSEHDVPAERGRDELRERLVTTLATPLGVQVNRAIAEAEAAPAPQEARGPDIEALAEAVHDAYLATCARLGWDVKPANRVPYAELSEDSKELDRASVRAVLAGLAAARPAPETREPEVLGYVVERQHTPGEWVRVWRGSTLWFDHEEAVLERDAYALDGIPARIRPVYLGAPAPAEATLPTAAGAPEEGAGT